MTYKDGVKRESSTEAEAHRELVVLDPPMQGRDIASVNRATKARIDARDLDIPTPTHDKFTHAAAVAAVEAQYFLGLRSETYLKVVKVGDDRRLVLTEGAQRYIRDPGSRTDEHLARAEERQGQLDRGPRYYDDLAKEQGVSGGRGVEAAFKWSDKVLGVKESPPGSNWGRPVQDWIKLTGYVSPVPWCFAAGTLVNTPAGLRRIETIQAGDPVMDAHGGVSVVGGAHTRRATDRFRLVAHGIDGTTVSGEHPYIARRRLTRPGRANAFGPPEWITVRDLSRGDLIAQPVLGGAMEMDTERAYLVGRWLADGWGTQRKARRGRSARKEYFICDSHNERDALKKALDDAQLGYSERIYPTVVQFAMRVDAVPLLADCGMGAAGKRLPRNALMWNAAARQALMDGYLAGDGCSYRGTMRANSISRELTLGMAQIARSLGHIVTMRADHREPTAVIAGRTVSQAPERYSLVFNPEGRPERGHRQYLAGGDEYVWVPVRGVDEVAPGPVYNLTVSGESTYIADGYAVHNCGCFANAFVIAGGVPNGAGWIGYTPAIIAHARAKKGGWTWHGPSEGRRGDLALFDTPGGDLAVHVGAVRQKVSNIRYLTREGNTGSSNADGGQLQDRDRSTQGTFRIVGFARPPYPS